MFSRQIGIFFFTPLCRVSFKDLKSKRILERRQMDIHKVKLSENEVKYNQLDNFTELRNEINVNSSHNREEREKMQELLKEQEQRRIARREAFLQWQSGQREKGAAHRLVRQAKTQEKFKRHRYHTLHGRLISVALTHENERNMQSHRNITDVSADSHIGIESFTDFLVPHSIGNDKNKLFLTLRKQ